VMTRGGGEGGMTRGGAISRGATPGFSSCPPTAKLSAKVYKVVASRGAVHSTLWIQRTEQATAGPLVSRPATVSTRAETRGGTRGGRRGGRRANTRGGTNGGTGGTGGMRAVRRGVETHGPVERKSKHSRAPSAIALLQGKPPAEEAIDSADHSDHMNAVDNEDTTTQLLSNQTTPPLRQGRGLPTSPVRGSLTADNTSDMSLPSIDMQIEAKGLAVATDISGLVPPLQESPLGRSRSLYQKAHRSHQRRGSAISEDRGYSGVRVSASRGTASRSTRHRRASRSEQHEHNSRVFGSSLSVSLPSLPVAVGPLLLEAGALSNLSEL
jgi:hypothetical protein